MILFAVKLWDTESAARSLLPCIGPDTGLISFQNGVQKDDMLRPIVGDTALIGGTSYVSAAITAPGVITQTGAMQGLAFGEFDGRRSKRVEDFHQACLAGGIQSEISPDINLVIWQKFVFLASVAGATTSMRAPIGAIRDNPLTRQFLLDLMKEIVAVGRARGVALAPDFAERQIAFADTLPAGMIASMYHDLQSGKPLELPWLNGGVVDLGADVRRADAAQSRGARCADPACEGEDGDVTEDASRLSLPDRRWVWKALVAGLCGMIAHWLLMYFKSRSGLLPTFNPYALLQAMLTRDDRRRPSIRSCPGCFRS